MHVLVLLLTTLACRVPPLGPLDTGSPGGEDSGESGGADSGGTDSAEPADPCADPDRPWLGTSTGCVLGASTPWGESFLGVPYAEPPVDALRFRPPVSVTPWEEPLEADALGSPCLQTHDSPDGALFAGEGDEDCLTLNIWRPAEAEDLPILFFVHGGQFLHGSGGVPDLAGDPSLSRHAVVVTHNARLGPFGYLVHPGLDALNRSGVSGNQGLLDTLLALRWVNDNAAALGGDPDRVLLVGQESGGLAACALLMSPLAEGLMDGVFLHSAPCGLLDRPNEDRDPGLDAQSGADVGEALADALQCWGSSAVELDCLQAATAEDVLGALPARAARLMDDHPWEPTVDGYLLPDTPAALIGAGAVRDLPVFAGVNADEGTIYADEIGADHVEAVSWPIKVKKLLGAALGVEPGEVVFDDSAYTEEAYGSWSAAFTALYGDLVHVCATRSFLGALSRSQAAVYGYTFTHAPSYADITLGSFTGAELPFLFGTRSDLYTEEEAMLGTLMQATWLWSLDATPTVFGLGPWPAISSGEWVVLGDDGEPWTEVDPFAERCAAIDATGWQSF